MKCRLPEFTEDDMIVIRDLFADELCKKPEASYADEYLSVINKCQRFFGNDEYKDVKQFMNDDSGTWAEIHEREEEDEK